MQRGSLVWATCSSSSMHTMAVGNRREIHRQETVATTHSGLPQEGSMSALRSAGSGRRRARAGQGFTRRTCATYQHRGRVSDSFEGFTGEFAMERCSTQSLIKRTSMQAMDFCDDMLVSVGQAGQDWTFSELCSRKSKRILITLYRITTRFKELAAGSQDRGRPEKTSAPAAQPGALGMGYLFRRDGTRTREFPSDPC